jgi:pilus assembly protein Flp/PilA
MLDILMAYIRPYMKREEGQALVEYALILSLVSVAAVGTLTILGTSVSDIFDTITGSL